MNTNLDIGRLVAAASKRLGLDYTPAESEALAQTMSRAVKAAPYALDEARMAASMLGYPLTPEVVLNAKSAPNLIGITVRDEEKTLMPIKCVFLVGHRVALEMACMERGLGVLSSERVAYAFYLMAYAIRLEQPVG
jgi:hypothetical protein